MSNRSLLNLRHIYISAGEKKEELKEQIEAQYKVSGMLQNLVHDRRLKKEELYGQMEVKTWLDGLATKKLVAVAVSL